jgi:hypothetical protein
MPERGRAVARQTPGARALRALFEGQLREKDVAMKKILPLKKILP